MFRPGVLAGPKHTANKMSNGKFDICGEFKEPLELMEDSDKHLFITGKAGSGKSTLLRYFKDITKKTLLPWLLPESLQ